jgi:hypothetical protein
VKVFNVPEIGTVKTEIVLTRDTEEVCDFLGLLRFCLDGRTRMTSKQTFEILTTSQIFESELYKNKAFKKRHKVESRPLSKEFFLLLENYHDPRDEKSCKQENIFWNYRQNIITSTEYYSKICEHFAKVDQLNDVYRNCERQKDKVETYKCKFSFDILLISYPEMDKELAGNILRRLKSELNDQESGGFDKWVTETNLKPILQAVERIRVDIERTESDWLFILLFCFIIITN